MQVKQRLRINVLVSIVSLLAILVVLFLTMYRVNTALEAKKIADGIITTAFEQVTLRTDYLLTGNERSKLQVIVKQQQIGELLGAASQKFSGVEDRKTVSELLSIQGSIGKNFNAIIENREKRQPSPHDSLSQEIEDRLLNQLSMKLYDVVTLGGKLQESSNENVNSALRSGGWGILSVLLFVSAAIFINSWTTGLSIMDRIGRLRNGASVIGSGDLNQRIDVEGDDEFSELSEAFNDMTEKLSGSYRELRSEIALRKKAEEEQETTVEFLRLVNDSHNTKGLIHATTDFFQKRSGCEAVGIRLHKKHDYPYFETRGFSKDFVQLESRLCSCDDEGNPILDSTGNTVLDCMCGNVICGRFDPSRPFFTKRGNFWSNCTTDLLASTSDEDRQARTRNRCNGEGYESVALIGLVLGVDRLGLLQLNDRRKGRFTLESINYWERLSDYLVVALAKFQAEESLSENEEKLRLFVEYAPAAIAMLDSNMRYVAVSRRWYTAYGVKEPDVIGRSHYDIFPDIPEQWKEIHRRCLAGAIERKEEDPWPRADGHIDWVRWEIRPWYKDENMVDGLIIFSENITEQKSAEAQVLKLSENLAFRNAELETLNKELEAFSYSVSHDLRAPLRTISGFSKMFYEDYADRLDTQGKDYLIRIKNGSDRMSQLIEDLLRLSHVSRQKVERIDYDLSSLASGVISSLREAYPERNVEAIIAEGLRVVIDPNLMKIALTNLFENAWKFTSQIENAHIKFGAFEKDAKTVYFVRDNGAGFDPAFAEKMFLPFYRLHTEKEFHGTGIGLAIVERIIRRHEGKVWAEGEVGKGATIYFTLG